MNEAQRAEYRELVEVNKSLTTALSNVRARMLALVGESGGEPYRIALRPDIKTEDPLDAKTLLDDIVVNDVPMFRAEQMDRNVWWVCCYLDNDTHDRIAWDVRAKSNPLRIEWTGYEYPDAATYEHERKPKS